MENLRIEGTKKTPNVDFDLNGRLILKGRSIPEDPANFYTPVAQWIKKYCLNPCDSTIVDINLEYFNSGSSKSLLQILKDLANVSIYGRKLTVNWFYEEGDEDILERGEYFATLVTANFNFVEVK
jgi:hypothetical protein